MLIPILKAKSSPQVAVFSREATGADAQISSFSRLYAGGVNSTRPGWAQANICGEKKKRLTISRLFLDLVGSLALSAHASPPVPPSRRCSRSHTTLPTTASCHREQNWEHNQLRYTGERLICSIGIKDAPRVPIKRSHWARSQKKLSSSPFVSSSARGGGLQALLCNNGHCSYYRYNRDSFTKIGHLIKC